MKRLFIISLIYFFSMNTTLAFGGDDIENKVDGENAVGVVHTGKGDVNIGIPPEMYKELQDKFVASQDNLHQVEKEYQLTQLALDNFLRITQQKAIPDYELFATLHEMAKQYNELLLKAKSITSEDEAVKALLEQAYQALEQGNFDTAERLFNEASDLDIQMMKQAQAELERMQEVIHKRALSAAESKAANGQLKMTQLAYKEAAEYYQEAANLLPEGEWKLRAEYLNWAGYNFDDAGFYDRAQVHYEQALALRERSLDKDDPDIATSLNNLALLYYAQGKYAEAEPLYEKALGIRKRALGEEHPDVATNLNNLALLYASQGKYVEAESLYQRALAIDEKVLSKEHPSVATDLNNLASLYDLQGKYVEAEPLYQMALAIYEKVLDSEHPHVATSLNNLAALYYAQGKYAEAEPLYEKALGIRKRALGEEHPDVATSLNNLAGLYYAQGKYVEAEPLYEKALGIWKRALGEEHPDVATSLNNLAGLYKAQGKYAEAKLLYERCLVILKKTLPPEHDYIRWATQSYNDLLEKMGEGEQD